jgi:glycine cleavage system H protein
MSEIRDGLYYSREHEWVKAEGSEAFIGITDHAQASLGDIVFVQGEPVGTKIKAGDVVGSVESVKAASDVFSPVSGTVAEVNQALLDTPERVNSEPYECWFVKLKLDDTSELNALMDAAAYKEFCGEEA